LCDKCGLDTFWSDCKEVVVFKGVRQTATRKLPLVIIYINNSVTGVQVAKITADRNETYFITNMVHAHWHNKENIVDKKLSDVAVSTYTIYYCIHICTTRSP